MKSYKEFLTEAMEYASSVSMSVSCSPEEFKESLKGHSWLSGKLSEGIASFFGPQSDIDRWLAKNSAWLMT
ncbi:Hypothetical protein KNT65_gp283 [Escherichia phage EcS1]|uniref:Uncharacterized protein n=1 Tax=Escherichia phage EcS1 TaxID=2083276 RepID=A0A2Z5ZC51_9CAUD|nr:Hypothetical protein KNT65_gp283 [Escherichia phage EcS1]BBC78210.1 Hypothetical protein [Escherichia phage EcS1]